MSIALLLAVRFLHLSGSHYWLVNQDSGWFYHLARLLDSGEPVTRLHSGLAYPVHWLSGIFGLDTASLLIAPLLSVGLLLIIYYAAYRMADARVAGISALAFALMAPAMFIGYAGNLDRDIGTLLIFTITILLYFHTMYVRDSETEAVLAVALGAIALFIYWSWVGAVVLGAMVFIVSATLSLAPCKARFPWKLTAIMGGAGIALMVTQWPYLSHLFGQNIAELSHNPNAFILGILPFAFVIAFGIRQARKSGNELGYFLLAWVAGGAVMGLIAMRLAFFCIPALCILAGLGYYHMQGKSAKVLQSLTLTLAILGALFLGYMPPRTAVAPDYWVEACQWLETNTSPDSVIATEWSNGYWVLAIANRPTYVNNGSHTPEADSIVADLYCSTNDREASETLSGIADYLIMSRTESNYFKAIVSAASYSGDRPDTLFERAFAPTYQSPYFTTVYRQENIIILQPTY